MIKGINLTDMADLLDITPGYLSLIENGRKKSSEKVVRNAVKSFGSFKSVSEDLLRLSSESEKLCERERHLLISLISENL